MSNFGSIVSSNSKQAYLNRDPVSPSSNANLLYSKNKDHDVEPKRIVNRSKVFYGMIWYAGSLVGYCMMENY